MVSQEHPTQGKAHVQVKWQQALTELEADVEFGCFNDTHSASITDNVYHMQGLFNIKEDDQKKSEHLDCT